MLKKILLISFTLLFNNIIAQNYHQYVNPMIGTGGTGHTFPGATTPFGMVQLSPDTRIDNSWSGCSGYHYVDNIIYGFSHTHLNGTGVSDYGDILLMPTMGTPSIDNNEYSSNFSHQNEKASAGFYSVKLDKHNIDVNLTTSTRVGFHQYTFNQDGQANIVLDLEHRDLLLDGEIKILDKKTIQVFRRSKAWANNQHIYAYITFDKDLDLTKSNQKNTIITLSRNVKKGEKIQVKVALSLTGYQGAKLNSSEINHWDFNQVKIDAEQLWNKELSKIEVTSNNYDKLTVFYTAMYHVMTQPNIAQDLDGKYRGRDNLIHTATDFDYYTVFSLWDTFRAAHPLYTLIDKKRTLNFIKTFLKQYEQGGRLPVWEFASNETDCMIGYHSVSVIADAMTKGITGFNYELAFEAAKHSSNLDWLGIKAYKENAQITIDDEHESVSKQLEYAYDDWCIAQMALLLNKQDDYQHYMTRSQYWKNTFDWNTSFMRPKKNAGWESPFDPKEVNNNYTEGNSWQYSFFVPQDIEGMIALYGGKEKFEAKLDQMFSEASKTTGRHQVDITGLIGQYAHGNEPSHHMAYLYNYVGKPEKTKKLVHKILDEFYPNSPDGLIGNEDCGQMSAWYILSSMGLYSITPGHPRWTTTEPYFDKIIVNFEDGTSKTITKNTPKTELESFGFENIKVLSQQYYPEIVTNPVIQSKSKTFIDSLEISIKTMDAEDGIWYQTQEITSGVKTKFKRYTKPFTINKSTKVLAFSCKKENIKNVESSAAIDNSLLSKTIQASYFKKNNDWDVTLNSKASDMYFPGGANGLIDGVTGSENWRKGDWHGYTNQDFEAIIDLKKQTKISSLGATFLQDTRSWILMPTQVIFEASTDGKHFNEIASLSHDIQPENEENIIYKFETQFKTKKVRYIKVKAKNFGKLPSWHLGYSMDGNAFIFIDEIYIK